MNTESKNHRAKSMKTTISTAKRAALFTLSALLLAQPLLPIHNVLADGVTEQLVTKAASASSTVLLSEEPITSGATLQKYQFSTVRSGKKAVAIGNVIKVDLDNPYVKLDVMTGTKNKFTTLNSVSNMAKETGAVAGVNGDYFNTAGPYVPLGGQVYSGQVMATPSYLEGMYGFALTATNRPVIDIFTFSGKVTAQDGSMFKLAGVNKAPYYHSNPKVHSHANALHIYTSDWTNVNRANDGATKPLEVLVEDNFVKQISEKTLPITPPENGYILRANGTAADYVRAHLHLGEKVTSTYSLQTTNPNQPVDMTGVKTLIGGHTILVNAGQPAAFSRDVSSISPNSYRSRTALGYSKDGKYAYIITSDAKGGSAGMNLKELQQFMIKVGVWKGLNLDGGGSTTMVSRPLGEFNAVLANTPENGSQRRIVNGFGVFSLAPQGAVKGIAVQGETNLLINEQAEYKMKAYDQFYNPVDVSSMPANWSASSPIGAFAGNTFVASKPGKATLTVASGTAKKSLEVNVIGRDQLHQMKVDQANPVLLAGASYKLPVLMTTVEGKTRTMPAASVKWELVGFQGRVEDGTIYVDSVNENTPGYAIARYDGFSTLVPFASAEQKLWNDFDTNPASVSFSASQPEITGSAAVVTGLPGGNASGLLNLTYDFTNGTGTKAAYADFAGGAGYPVEGQPKAMKMDVLGDNSLNWLRAEVTDAKGVKQLVTIAKAVDWSGWKTLSIDLSSYKLSYPVTFKRIYVASLEEAQDERALVGDISIDNIQFQYDSSAPGQGEANSMTLTLNNKAYYVNGVKKALDQAPKAVAGVTYIPVKFVTDALGGSTTYNTAAKQVSIMRGNRLMELWFNDKDYVLNGVRGTAASSPVAMGGRTMIPLRLVSEKLGLKVIWEPKTQSVTIE
ncbi:hypothetical protein SY83_10930 [Paenibacillus swuensis]|uniref:Copper amine oxidase n=1 Tax=Paenibacillus swuensis TaxID=1178515 RepID=A0A172TIB0_9BACL|nr:phosphodiester glycosidase family protein [Paenibacillus swuensis]ANE46702.1 hypothetical protein SY83_10930 [Paenibacillus swuensis]